MTAAEVDWSSSCSSSSSSCTNMLLRTNAGSCWASCSSITIPAREAATTDMPFKTATKDRPCRLCSTMTENICEELSSGLNFGSIHLDQHL